MKLREYPTKRRTSPPESSAVESFLRYNKTEVHEFEEKILVAEERKKEMKEQGGITAGELLDDAVYLRKVESDTG